MSRIPPVLKPVNRHLTIVPHVQKNETSTGVLLPDGFEPEEDKYITATVIDIASDCSPALRELRGSNSRNKVIVIDRSMMEEIKVRDKSYFTILENYVIGMLRGLNEN
jgi:co-chaperonin GroES (HSP10)